MKKILISFAMIFTMILVGCGNYTYISEEVTGKVINKDYVYPRCDMMIIGDMIINNMYPEEYNVYFEYEQYTGGVDSAYYFNNYSVGDDIELILYNKYDEDGNYINSYLTLNK